MKLLILALFTVSQAFYSTEWTNKPLGLANLSAVQYDNWPSGEDAISWNLRLNESLERDAFKSNLVLKLESGYGMAKMGDQGFRKSIDDLFAEAVYFRKMTDYLNPYADIKLKTQLMDFMEPGFLSQGLGLGTQHFKPLIIRAGFSLKETFLDDLEKIEPGAELSADFNGNIVKNLSINTVFNTFTNFKGRKEIDFRLENLLIIQILKYLNANIEWDIVYDRDISATRQTKQILSIGVNYSFE